MSTTRKRRRLGIGVALAALVAALAGTGLLLIPRDGESPRTQASGAQADDAAGPELNTVAITTGDLVEEKEGVGNVSYGDTWAAPLETQGVVTRSHPKGTVVQPGEPLIWVANLPVTLARGETPMYRTLALRRDSANKLMQGDDVLQLQQFLLDQGFDDPIGKPDPEKPGRLTADGVFGPGTQRAVKAWQKSIGAPETGSVDRSQLAFSPDAVRIASTPRVGAAFTELLITEPNQKISASFDTRSRGFLTVGSTVSMDLGDGQTETGTIRQVEATVGDDGSGRLTATVEPASPLAGDIERVKITVSRDLATNALLVPVRAIVALAGGGYAVELATPTGPALTRVELGAVVDDIAEVSGDIADGDQVVVPERIGGS